MADTAHIDALSLRLSHERARLAKAKTDGERDIRMMWVAGIEKEIAAEYKFLGINMPTELHDISDDDLLALLLA